MKALGLNEIRETYLKFFEEKGHLRLPSFSLVPQDDPSILLINAGMTPMKPYFRGTATPPSKRITTCQKCIRTPDIEQVGLTSRHGTFFEMLGNFSFGDYFKEEMIPWSWEFITDVLNMPVENLYVSVFEEDDEAYDIWKDTVGLDASHIARLGKEDNFWEHGTGPCGPSSEIFYDRGVEHGCGSEDCAVGCECDRFVEFWNLVFTQFDKQEDGSYVELSQKNIDTGAGLERVASIMQGVDNLFEVDTIRSILVLAAKIADVEYGKDHQTDTGLRVITDHIRSTTMLIADGVMPSNEGRGYVLRRLLRRAARYGRLLGITRPFLVELAEEVIRQSGDAYGELKEHQSYILTLVEKEEESFNKTIDKGQELLDGMIAEAKAEGVTELAAKEVFRLHDTYGFPLDLTREIAQEQGFTVDEVGFVKEMEGQRQRARKALKDKGGAAWSGDELPAELKQTAGTVFSGYDTLVQESTILVLLATGGSNGNLVLQDSVEAGRTCLVILDETPFYAEAGGQVADIGVFKALPGSNEILATKVTDVQKNADGLYLHTVEVMEGVLESGQKISAEVDKKTRNATARNHTTTHLLHRALRDVLGEHVHQSGSLVSPEYMRFDFSHFQAVTTDELLEIEKRVNEAILEDYPVTTAIMSIQEAKEAGAMALFDEKYGDAVRVVSCGEYASELCGGTHLKHTSQASYFRILNEASVAAGIRRIEAVTGAGAFQVASEDASRLRALATELRTSKNDLLGRVRQMQQQNRSLEQDLRQLESKLARESAQDLDSQAEVVNGVHILAAEVQAESMDILRELADGLRDRLAPSVVTLASANEGKVNMVVTVSKELTKQGFHAGNIIREAASLVGGGGGGRPDMAQAGGKDPDGIQDALARASEIAHQQANA